MLSSPIGRLRFFLYSVAISIAELIAVAFCVAATMGFGGFVHSKPGPSREGLALASFVVMMMFVVARTNITWRRGYDADLSKWLVVPYIVFLALLAGLQATTLLIYDFKTGNTNIGLGIFSTALFALWIRICVASSKERLFDPDSFYSGAGLRAAPSGGFRRSGDNLQAYSRPKRPPEIDTRNRQRPRTRQCRRDRLRETRAKLSKPRRVLAFPVLCRSGALYGTRTRLAR